MQRPVTEDELQDNTRHVLKDMMRVFCKIGHDVGFARGRRAEDAWYPPFEFSCLDLNWHTSMNTIKLNIQSLKTSLHDGTTVQIFSQWDNAHYALDYQFGLIGQINELCQFVLPGINIVRNIGYCQSPLHRGYDACDFIRNGFDKNHNLQYISGKWLCTNCIDALMLTASITQKHDTPEQADERKKMTVGLRFQILERDGFKCRVCGRNPREDNVKLHVDHIHPVARGGKSVPENLQVLCQDCNLAKSDNIYQQMSLWEVA